MNTQRQRMLLIRGCALALLMLFVGAPLAKEARAQRAYPSPCDPGEIEMCYGRDPYTKECLDSECVLIEEVSPRGGAEVTRVQSIRQVKLTLENVVGWIQISFYIVATLLIILAAWDYLNSGGDETKVKAAKNKVLYSLVAIAIAVIAGGVVTLVRNFVG